MSARLRSRRSRQYGACFGSTTKLAQSTQTAGLRPAASGASLPPQRAVSAWNTHQPYSQAWIVRSVSLSTNFI